MLVRTATDADLPWIVEIYNHHVSTGHATFDATPLTVTQRHGWFDTFSSEGRHRCLVAVDGSDRVGGYACSRPYRDHPAFDHTVELSVYLDPAVTGEGVGTLLYRRLLEQLSTEDIHRFVAGIALPNQASIALHQRFGFTEIGVFDEYATKNGTRVSSVWMQRCADDPPRPPPGRAPTATEVRSLTVSECGAAVRLWHNAGLTRPWNPPESDFRRAVAGPSSTVLGVVDDGQVVATAMVGHDGHRGWVYYVAVEPTRHGDGFGRTVTSAAERWLSDRGVAKVQLMVRHGNDEALGFYEHLGYADAGVTVMARWLRGGPDEQRR